MIILKLQIDNFRNIKHAYFEFDKNVNIFFGDNAQGKTNVMEAIAICTGNNFRRVKEYDFIPFDSNDNVSIKLWFTENEDKNSVYYNRENIIDYTYSNNRKILKLNGILVKEIINLYSLLKTVIFIPEHLKLISGSSEIRRDFFDELAVMQNKIHLKKINRYNKALKQKNNLLKLNQTQDYISSWNEILCTEGINIIYGRLKSFSDFKKITDNIYSKISNENLNIEYVSSIYENLNTESITNNNFNEMYNTYIKKLNDSYKDEIIRKHTIIGVHRDEIKFFINGHDSRHFASQGQKRSIAVALKLAECELIRQKSKDNPVIILDDVLSELDEKRRSFILSGIKNLQVFITCCNINDVKNISNKCCWKVLDGNFEKM